MDLTEESMKGRRYRRRHLSMTVLLCIIIALLTAALLLIQDKNAPRYIQIYENEQ